MSDEIVLISPSYRRGATKTHVARYLPSVLMAVHASEAAAYRKSGHNVVEVPDSLQGNIAKVRNWILRKYEDARGVVMIDDDVSRLFRFENCRKINLDEDDVLEFIESGFLLAEEYGVKLWGVNIVNDKSAYRENTPISLLSPVLGVFTCVLPGSGLLYDERFSLKEDYDYFIQNVNKYRGALRFNMVQYVVDHKGLAGGCSGYRNIETEREQFARLRKKWGGKIVLTQKGDGRTAGMTVTTRKRKFDTNPLIHIPIGGV